MNIMFSYTIVIFLILQIKIQFEIFNLQNDHNTIAEKNTTWSYTDFESILNLAIRV